MTLPQTPARPDAPGVGVFAAVREALNLIRTSPRQTVLPMLAIEVPVAVISAIATAVLYFTAFRHESVYDTTGVINSGTGGQLFALLVIAAFEVLFAQVARGATIVGVARARDGEHPPLVELLDPAFTRMGGLFAVAIISTGILALGIITSVTVVGAVIALFIFIRWAVAFEAYMLEELRVFPALRRSWTLMRGNMLRYIGVLLVSFALILVPFVAISLLQLAVVGGRTVQIMATAAITIGQGILVVPLLAFLSAVTTVYYFRIKERADATNLARN